MNVLIVDDESLARSRLRTLLEELPEFPCRIMEASAVNLAEDILQKTQGNAAIDLVLLDIHMPETDGVSFAETLRKRPQPPAIVFVTAHTEYATAAFDVEAIDYLTKPVRLDRLRQALKRVQIHLNATRNSALSSPHHTGTAAPGALPAHDLPDANAPFVVINERNRAERVLIANIVYCRAELKYVTLMTPLREYVYDGSLAELERDFPGAFLRIHRNALIAHKALKGLLKQSSKEEGEQWVVQLHGSQHLLPISRRLLPTVRAMLHARHSEYTPAPD
ncbi:response regulator transcription factor [Lampropedia puyangensis]|uniref:Response regulator transcription factor n=1 Tax=Lampropedia puyangensis TaxID=1330072 RepID=A0A4V4GS19_9BURK|nr:LytTR family DNA-binding domain-containing protein [Lampropedia puyangensis]THU04416.1 response regulator transcription factor [Lampropedia puyangensis]